MPTEHKNIDNSQNQQPEAIFDPELLPSLLMDLVAKYGILVAYQLLNKFDELLIKGKNSS